MKELEEALQSFYATNPFKFSGKADRAVYPRRNFRHAHLVGRIPDQ
jgi:hypothetical protein